MTTYSYDQIQKRLQSKQEDFNRAQEKGTPAEKERAAEGLGAAAEQLAGVQELQASLTPERIEENRRIEAAGRPLEDFSAEGPLNFSGASEGPGFVDDVVKPLAFATGRAATDVGQGFKQNVNILGEAAGFDMAESSADMAARLEREHIADERVAQKLFPGSEGTRQAMRGSVHAAPIAAGLAAGGVPGAAAVGALTPQRDAEATVGDIGTDAALALGAGVLGRSLPILSNKLDKGIVAAINTAKRSPLISGIIGLGGGTALLQNADNLPLNSGTGLVGLGLGLAANRYLGGKVNSELAKNILSSTSLGSTLGLRELLRQNNEEEDEQNGN